MEWIPYTANNLPTVHDLAKYTVQTCLHMTIPYATGVIVAICKYSWSFPKVL